MIKFNSKQKCEDTRTSQQYFQFKTSERQKVKNRVHLPSSLIAKRFRERRKKLKQKIKKDKHLMCNYIQVMQLSYHNPGASLLKQSNVEYNTSYDKQITNAEFISEMEFCTPKAQETECQQEELLVTPTSVNTNIFSSLQKMHVCLPTVQQKML